MHGDTIKNVISKAIITSAGVGSRMKRVTAVVPKALLPLFKTENGVRIAVPVVDYIMESLTLAGIQSYCLVVGKHKSLLMDYFYEKDGINFVVQSEPKGFGDAVLRGADFASKDAVFVHADDGVLTGGYVEAASLFDEKRPDAVLLLRETDNPKRYGIAEVSPAGEFMGHKIFKVNGVEEKPQNPKSKMMLSAVYIFSHRIFDSLKTVKAGSTGEVELTDGISKMIESGAVVYGILLEKERWLNVGDAESYYKALSYSYEKL